MLAKINPNSHDPKDKIILVCDGAAWHKSGSLRIPENIELVFIPPYTPEMNPIEQIWKEIRKRGFKVVLKMKCFNHFKRSLTDFVILSAHCLMKPLRALPEEIGFYPAFKWCLY